MEMEKENLQSQILGRKLLLDSSSVTRTPLRAVNQQTAKHTPLPLCVKKLVHAQCKTEENKRHSWAPETGASLKSSGALIRNAEHNTPTRTSKYSDRLQKRISLMKVAKARLERTEVASPGGCLVPESPTTMSRRPCQPAVKSASYPLVSSVLKRHEPEILSRVDVHQDAASLQEATVPSPGCVHATQNSEAGSFQNQVVEEPEQPSKHQRFTDACSIHVEQSTDHALEAVSSIVEALLRAVERKADVPLTNLSASKSTKESYQLNVSSADSPHSSHDGEWNNMDWQGIMLQLPPPDLLSPYTNEYCRFLASYPRNTNEIHSETPIKEPILNAFSSEKEHFAESPSKRSLWDRNAKRQGDFRSPEDMNSKICLDSLELTVLQESIHTGYGSAKSGNIAKESEDMVQSSVESDSSANAGVCLNMQELAEKMTRSTELLSVNVTSQVAVSAVSTSLSCGECNEEKRVFLVETSSLSLSERTAAEIELVKPSSKLIQFPSADPRNVSETALSCPNLESEGVPGLPEKVDGDTVITKDQTIIDDAMVTGQAEDTATTTDTAEIMGKDNCLIAVSEIDTKYESAASKDVALSPVRIPGLEVDTMTTSIGTADVGLETETMESVDHSMLATTDTQHQTTMTDNTGCLSVYTSMTPFKLLRKQGQRLTSNDIRKQHPRTLANQLETLAVCNARLEMELQLGDRERTRLRAAVKEMKAALASKEEEKMEIEDKKLNEWKEKENQLTEQIKALEQEAEVRQKYMEEMEAEVLILRQAGASLGRLHEEEVSELQGKCHSLEKQVLKAAVQHENEVSELKAASEASSYERQFRCAMQMVKEREAELEELRSLFGDLEEAVHRQEKVTKVFEEVHKKVKLFATEHVHLRTQLAQQDILLQSKCRKQEETSGQVEEERQQLLKETQNWRQMVELNQGNMAELEKLYSVASSDLITATSQLVKLNSELLGTRKALQELLLSKDALAQEAIVLQDKLTAAQHDNAVTTETVARTQMELHKRAQVCEEFRHINRNLKQEYEDKLENMVLGIENLQRTLDNREVDIDNLEKDLYECRNIIVEQRYKIDALEKDLLDARGLAVLEDKDNIEFLKESNLYLEAERSLYVSSLRDLEEKLRVASLEARCQQQVAADAEELVVQLEHEKLDLISEAKSLRQQLGKTSHALALADAEHSKMESYAIAAASDLLQRMQEMLNELKKKIGMQEKPSTMRAAKQDLAHTSLSNASKPKHCYDRSFVSYILDAVLEPPPCGDSETSSQEGRLAALERKEHCRHANDSTANNSDMAAVMNASGDASSTGAGAFSSLEAVSPDKMEEEENEEEMVDTQHQNPIFQSLGLMASDLAFVDTNTVSKASKTTAHEGSKNMPLRREETRAHTIASNIVPFQPSASSVHGSSIVPPSSAPFSSAFARIRPIPRASSHTSANRRSFQEDSRNMANKEQSGIVACISMMEEVFTEIIRLGSILERASQLSLRDLKAENDMLRERTEILERGMSLSHHQLETSHQETAALETTVQQLKDRMQKMTEHIMSLTDKKFEVKRLAAEVRHLQKQADSERQEKEVIARELENLLKHVETSTGAVDEGSLQAKCIRDMITLRKKNQQLLAQLGEQQDHYEEMGSKAARRMQIMEDNWRKAEDEVYRFDELVESIRQTIQVAVDKGCSYPELVCILELIEGDNKQSVL